MPRKATNNVTEHRITLGDLERTELKKLVTAETFKDYGQFAQGTGLVLIGGGVVIASLVGVLKFSPQLFKWTKDSVFNVVNDISGDDGLLDNITDSLVKGNPIADRRAAQKLAKMRGKVAQNIDVFCTTSSDEYSQSNCSRAQRDKDDYFEKLYRFNNTVYITYHDAYEDPNNFTRVINFIYRGLGDIDPRHKSRADGNGLAGAKTGTAPSRRDSPSTRGGQGYSAGGGGRRGDGEGGSTPREEPEREENQDYVRPYGSRRDYESTRG